MKVIAILGGLGSQMFKYAFYLKLKEEKRDKCYISTIPFYMDDMWNGYELMNIFGIQEPDFIEFLSEDEIKQLREYGGDMGNTCSRKWLILHQKSYATV